FVYMYRTMVEGVAEEDALGAMNEVWDPAEVRQWEDLIERARTEFSGR
ncbi:MAG: hypothetical protein GWP44_15940, partial [Proteobacteria bacterium]|nr:hypothetical protein [Pseudomonadota bacterium]